MQLSNVHQSKAEAHPSIARALGEEHDAILRALEVLEAFSSRLGSREQVDYADLAKMNDFLTRFVDQCHHGKEEGALFPAMRGRGGDQPLMDDLLRDHADGRTMVRSMTETIRGTESGTRSDYSTLSKEYRELMIEHIERENTVALPLADKTLSDEEKGEVLEQFEEIEERIGRGEHHRLMSILDELSEKYAHGP